MPTVQVASVPLVWLVVHVTLRAAGAGPQPVAPAKVPGLQVSPGFVHFVSSGVPLQTPAAHASFVQETPSSHAVPSAFAVSAHASVASLQAAVLQAFADALKGVDAAFMITPVAENSDSFAQSFIDAAKQAGVKHVVKLSSAGADAEPGIFLTRLHRKAEVMLEKSGLGYTHLRPGMFAENLVNYWPPQKDGNIYVPFGDGKVSYVASDDVGAAAAAILLDAARHHGKAYLLTGPRAVGTDEAAALIAKATGRTVRYVDVPPEAARQSMLDMQTPAWMADGFLELFGLAKAGWLAAVTNDVEQLLARKPTSLESFIERRRAAWS